MAKYRFKKISAEPASPGRRKFRSSSSIQPEIAAPAAVSRVRMRNSMTEGAAMDSMRIVAPEAFTYARQKLQPSARETQAIDLLMIY
ncbi:hypothetical protein FAZ78_07205 [Cereibacter changlensis]|uniref:Uncharacterized protein n=1 Tax=Cereibacter changlensis TaxID=402884 RepID=A0A4U0Z6Q1_9RHOB|nr:hypothetical protein [Cereibacter changlensis]TKA97213.1 hypothetical protein FAZ78_07205 [Cereibacter changlensis]